MIVPTHSNQATASSGLRQQDLDKPHAIHKLVKIMITFNNDNTGRQCVVACVA